MAGGRRFELAPAANDAGRSQRPLAGFGEAKEIVDERSEEPTPAQRAHPPRLCVEYGVVASLNTFLGLNTASKLACLRPASVGGLGPAGTRVLDSVPASSHPVSSPHYFFYLQGVVQGYYVGQAAWF